VIVLTALNDEDTALSAMHCGAQDYLVKGRTDTAQLTRSIRYSIERQKLLTELDKRLKEIKTLQGFLPMCAWCRNIRDDKGYWKDLETYIQEHTDASFSHGICPECAKKVYPEYLQKENQDIQKQGRKQDKSLKS
jgi:YesN/AraC family two-component response regulator